MTLIRRSRLTALLLLLCGALVVFAARPTQALAAQTAASPGPSQLVAHQLEELLASPDLRATLQKLTAMTSSVRTPKVTVDPTSASSTTLEERRANVAAALRLAGSPDAVSSAVLPADRHTAAQLAATSEYLRFISLTTQFVELGGMDRALLFPGEGLLAGIFTAGAAVVGGVQASLAGISFYSVAILASGASVACAVGLGVVGALYISIVATTAGAAAAVAIQQGIEYDAAQARMDADEAAAYAMCLAMSGFCFPSP